MLSEIWQTQKDKYSMILFIRDTQKRPNPRYREQIWVTTAWGWGEEETGSYCLIGTQFLFGGDEKVLETGGDFTTL